MKSRLKFFLWIALMSSSCLNAKASSVPIEIKTTTLHMILTTSPIASLVYQIDCMADVIRCEAKTIQDYWKTQNWNDQDEKALQNWATIIDRYMQNQFQIKETLGVANSEVGFPIRNSSVSFRQKVRKASFLSQDLTSYRNSLSLLMQAPDVEQALEVLQHFTPRHQAWWKKDGERKTKAFTKDFAQLMKKKNLTALLPQVASFYQANISAQTPVYFHFFYMPGKTNQSSGEQVENHSVIEVPDGETAEERVDVILHELSHYFYGLAPINKHVQLVKSFATNPDPSSIAAYNLLNEVLATVIGNGLVSRKVMTAERFQRKFEKQNSFYNDAAIDSVSKRLLPKIDDMLQKGLNLYDPAFVPDYIELVKSTLAETVRTPKLTLRTMAVFYQSEYKKEFEKFARNIRSGSYWSTTDFQSKENTSRMISSPHLSAVIVIKPESLDLLESLSELISPVELKKIRALGKKAMPLLHPIQRTPNSWIFVVLVKTSEEATAALAKLENAANPDDLR